MPRASVSLKELVRRALVDARDYLNQHNWYQGNYFATSPSFFGTFYDYGTCCALGAVAYVTEAPAARQRLIVGENFGPLFERTSRILQRTTQQLFGTNVVSYNDAPGRTKEEVLALYDEAIDRLDAGQFDEILSLGA